MSEKHADTALASKPLARAVASAFGKPGLLAAATAGFVLSPTAFAATYTVGNLNDSGPSSLRDAIAQANANPGTDTITFASNVSGTITLTSGSLHIYDAVNLQGPGAGTLTIDGGFSTTKPSSPSAYGGYSDIVIDVGGAANKPAAALAATQITISGVTITGGSANKGGGINAYNALLNVNNCIVTGNYASDSGGGIYIGGDYSVLTVSNSTISSNSAAYAGGGVATFNGGAAVTIQQSSLSGNSAKYGGGIFVHNDNGNTLTITGSTISGNSVHSGYYYGNSYGGKGGGVYLKHTPLIISNSTIANNTADRVGGGVVSYSGNNAAVSNSTVSGNSANYAGGIVQYDQYDILTLTNSVVAGNTASEDPDTGNPSGGVIAAAFSLIGNTGGSTITDNGGNLLNVAPQLGALANNGGPTMTMLPLAGSPLIDAGDPAFSGPATDQRGAGFPRIINGRVDIGAVEFGTAAAAEKIPAPTLGLGGQLGLGALLGLAGLAVARRRRSLGTAAGILLATALSVSAPTPAQAKYADRGGHGSRQDEATTITRYSVQGKIVTIVLGDGQILSVRKGQVHTIDRRSNATSRLLLDPSTVASGTPAAVHYETGRQGNKVRDVSIRLTDTLQQAQALVAKKP
ncbi:MAG: choice-of-anchor Q domain-containing protein [Rudaea sp.]